MLTKCADSHSGSRADNEKHIAGKARRDGGGEEGADELRMELFQISEQPLLLSFLEKFTFFPCKSTSAPCFSLKYT